MSESSVEAAGLHLAWNDRDLAWTVRKGHSTWQTAPSSDDLVLPARKDSALSLKSAGTVKTDRFSNGAVVGFVSRLSDFPDLGAQNRLSVFLTVVIETATGDVIASVSAEETPALIRTLWWPGPVVFDSPDGQETVFPLMQGVLIPGGWPHDIGVQELLANHRLMYMPWWGQKRGSAGYTAIIEHEADAGCRLSHPAGGPTAVGPRWDGSLGSLSYPRSMRYTFFETCNYVSMAKHYRAHVKRTGRFVSLREKITARPKLSRLIGSPVVHIGIAHNTHPESKWYNHEDVESNRGHIPFSTRAKQLKALKARGVEKACVHLDGWGVNGYDNDHPDYLPPHEAAGGWDGLRDLTDTCHELGYLMTLHDQYRDYYRSAPSFDEDNAIHDENGDIPEKALWAGGPQSLLCARFAPSYVLRNHLELKKQGIDVDGTYLDVFAVVPADECYHPRHPMTRRECFAERARCFEIIRDLEGIVSSEEPVDYAIPHLDLVHYAPYVIMELFVDRDDVAPPAIPLWNLVYHDALFIPWIAAPCEWADGMPDGESHAAHAALHGGMPYLDIEPDDAEIERVRELTELHSLVALEEMTEHEFLNDKQTLQRAVYSNGVSVTADVSTGAWEIKR